MLCRYIIIGKSGATWLTDMSVMGRERDNGSENKYLCEILNIKWNEFKTVELREMPNKPLISNVIMNRKLKYQYISHICRRKDSKKRQKKALSWEAAQKEEEKTFKEILRTAV